MEAMGFKAKQTIGVWAGACGLVFFFGDLKLL